MLQNHGDFDELMRIGRPDGVRAWERSVLGALEGNLLGIRHLLLLLGDEDGLSIEVHPARSCLAIGSNFSLKNSLLQRSLSQNQENMLCNSFQRLTNLRAVGRA